MDVDNSSVRTPGNTLPAPSSVPPAPPPPPPLPSVPDPSQFFARKSAPPPPVDTPPKKAGGQGRSRNKAKSDSDKSVRQKTSAADGSTGNSCPNVGALLAEAELNVRSRDNNQQGAPDQRNVDNPVAGDSSTSTEQSRRGGEKEKQDKKSTRKPRKPRSNKRSNGKENDSDNKGAQRTAGFSPAGQPATPTTTGISESFDAAGSSDSGGSRAFFSPTKGPRDPAAASSTSAHVPSHNRTWTAHGDKTGPASTNQAATSNYGRREGIDAKGEKICYDITSYKFAPEDEKRVELVLKRIHGDADYTDGNKPKIVHHLPTVFSAELTGIPADRAPGAQAQWDDSRFVTVPDFASLDPCQTALHPITRRDTVPFVLLSRSAGLKGGRWELASAELSKDFLNDAICKMFSQDIAHATAYDRTGSWGLATLVYIKSDSVQDMDNFRRQLTVWSFLGADFDTFPKDIIVAKPELSILLKDSMKTFQTELIPKVLFVRNKEVLAGALRVIATRVFAEHEVSKKGEAKTHWRQVDLKGDDQLLRCLRVFPESTPFQLGVDKVQIRGGLRPPEPSTPLLPPRQKRHWEGTRLLDHLPSSSSTSSSASIPPRGSAHKRGKQDRRGRRGRGRF